MGHDKRYNHHVPDQQDATSCQRKTRFANKATAKAHRQLVLRRSGVETWVYQCGFCRGFHLTSEPPERHRRRMRYQAA